MSEDKSQHFVGKICQKAIIVHEGKVLVTRGVGDSVWEFPGGRLHLGESAKVGLEREIQEELGINIVRGVAVYADRYDHLREKDMPHFGMFFICSCVGSPELTIDASEVQEFKWITQDELKVLPMYDDCHIAALAYIESQNR